MRKNYIAGKWIDAKEAIQVVHPYDYTVYDEVPAATAAKTIMDKLGAKDHTAYEPDSATSFSHAGQDYNFFGAGHLCGTHIRGTAASNSVVNSH